MQNINLFFICYINDKIIKFGMRTISFLYKHWKLIVVQKIKLFEFERKTTFLKHFL